MSRNIAILSRLLLATTCLASLGLISDVSATTDEWGDEIDENYIGSPNIVPTPIDIRTSADIVKSAFFRQTPAAATPPKLKAPGKKIISEGAPVGSGNDGVGDLLSQIRSLKKKEEPSPEASKISPIPKIQAAPISVAPKHPKSTDQNFSNSDTVDLSKLFAKRRKAINDDDEEEDENRNLADLFKDTKAALNDAADFPPPPPASEEIDAIDKLTPASTQETNLQFLPPPPAFLLQEKPEEDPSFSNVATPQITNTPSASKWKTVDTGPVIHRGAPTQVTLTENKAIGALPDKLQEELIQKALLQNPALAGTISSSAVKDMANKQKQERLDELHSTPRQSLADRLKAAQDASKQKLLEGKSYTPDQVKKIDRTASSILLGGIKFGEAPNQDKYLAKPEGPPEPKVIPTTKAPTTEISDEDILRMDENIKRLGRNQVPVPPTLPNIIPEAGPAFISDEEITRKANNIRSIKNGEPPAPPTMPDGDIETWAAKKSTQSAPSSNASNTAETQRMKIDTPKPQGMGNVLTELSGGGPKLRKFVRNENTATTTNSTPQMFTLPSQAKAAGQINNTKNNGEVLAEQKLAKSIAAMEKRKIENAAKAAAKEAAEKAAKEAKNEENLESQKQNKTNSDDMILPPAQIDPKGAGDVISDTYEDIPLPDGVTATTETTVNPEAIETNNAAANTASTGMVTPTPAATPAPVTTTTTSLTSSVTPVTTTTTSPVVTTTTKSTSSVSTSTTQTPTTTNSVNETTIIAATQYTENTAKEQIAVIRNIYQSMAMLNSNITSRLSFDMPIMIGVAAGDSYNIERGFWIKATNTYSKQGKDKNSETTKGKSNSISVGFDIETENNTILGIAYNDMRSKINTNATHGTTKSKAVLLYGQYELKNNFALRAITSYAKNDIALLNNSDNSQGKMKSNSYAIELSSIYKINLDNRVTITPQAGVRYNSFRNGKYSAVIGNNSTLDIDANTRSQLVGFLASKIERSYNFKSFIVRPSIHFGIEKQLNSRSSNINAHYRAKNIDIIAEVPILETGKNIAYNSGAGLTIQRNNVEFELDYNHRMQKKFKAHQAAIKVKLHF